MTFSTDPSPAAVRAAIEVPAIFSDRMVLQRSAAVPIWGKASPGEEITVRLAGRSATTRTGSEGKWRVELNLADSGPGPFELRITGSADVVTISDVLVGEVWLASGQSNMGWLLKDSQDAEQEIARSANPLIRQFLVGNLATETAMEDCSGTWEAADPATAGEFSAVAYHFARRLQEELQVPLGFIHAAWGATPAEPWISRDSLDTIPELKAARELLWRRQRSGEEPLAPDERVLSFRAVETRRVAGFIFNGMIQPIIPYAIRGALWYQGEGNAERAWQYRMTFPLLINDWRKQWGQGDFPFYFCQLANHEKKEQDPGESRWSELREAQTLALKLPHTGQAVLIDAGEAADIHPRNKRVAGERLALLALANDYGRNVPSRSPVYESMKIEGSRIRLVFRDTGEDLVAKPLPATYDICTRTAETAPLPRARPESELEGFAICGADRVWHWADARIEGRSVVVWRDEIPRPLHVRYAWANNPTCNLYSRSGLPASPFRTDDFPMLTAEYRY